MSKSALSVLIYGVFLAINGLILLLVPNMLLASLGIASTNEVWIRLSGLMLMAISVYYFLSAKHEIIVIMKATAYIRFTIIFFFVAFALFDLVSPNIIIISVIDLLSGIWTYLMLRAGGHFNQN